MKRALVLGLALSLLGCAPRRSCVDDAHAFASALCEPREPWEQCFSRLHAADGSKGGAR